MFYALLDGTSNTQSLPPALSMNCALVGLPTSDACKFINNTRASCSSHLMHMSSSCLGCCGSLICAGGCGRASVAPVCPHTCFTSLSGSARGHVARSLLSQQEAACSALTRVVCAAGSMGSRSVPAHRLPLCGVPGQFRALGRAPAAHLQCHRGAYMLTGPRSGHKPHR